MTNPFYPGHFVSSPGSFQSKPVECRAHIGRPCIERVGSRHRLPVGYQCPVSGAMPPRHHRTAFASLATLATSCGWPCEMKATRQSLGSHTSRWGIKILEVGREEGLLVCLPLVIRLLAKSEPLRTRRSSISGAKAKNLTLRHPIDEQFACSRPQPSALYYTNTNSSDRQNDQIEAPCERSQYNR
jgi:hypothetical protein